MLISVYFDKEPCTIPNDENALNVKYITGEVKNRKFCVGYCNLDTHPGYLTQKMVDEHKCHEKECVFFFEDININKAEKRMVIHDNKALVKQKELDEAEVLKLCQAACEIFEGAKVIKANKDQNRIWHLQYVSICTVDEALLKREIGNFIETDFIIKKIECDFDIAVKLVLYM